MYTKRQLREYLEQISEGAKLVKFDYVSSEQFYIVLKCRVADNQTSDFYNQNTKEWLKKFSKFTSTAWIVCSNFPKVKRMLFRKIYSCHRSSLNKRKKLERDGIRNTDCRAKTHFKVKFINRNTAKNDPLLKQGLNLTITIDFSHTHRVGTSEACNMLRSSSDTDNVFYDYFDMGYTPVAAKNFHELTIISKYGYDSVEYLSNSVNPSLHHVNYLYNKRKKEGLGNRSLSDVMAENKAKLNEKGGLMNFTGDSQMAVIVTPVMRRVVERSALEYVMVCSADASGGAPVCTNVYACGAEGVLPVACLLHADRSEASYSQAFFCLKLLLENECNKHFEPKVIMTDGTTEQINALDAIFSSSKVISSRVAMNSEAWRWLCDDGTKIERRKVHTVMALLHSLLRINSEDEARKVYLELKESNLINSSQTVIDYVDNLWQRRDRWLTQTERCLCDERVELSARVMSELIISKCKGFNICAMVDLVTEVVDSHWRHMLLSLLTGQALAATYTKLLAKCNAVLNMGPEMKRINTKEFRVVLQPKRYLNFRIDTWCCDCAQGKRAQFCEHLCAIINTTHCNVLQPELTEDERSLYCELVGPDVEESKLIKPETDRDEHFEAIETFEDEERIPNADDAEVSSPKTETRYDDYYYLEVKSEIADRLDPLDDQVNRNNDFKHYEKNNVDVTEFNEYSSGEDPSTSNTNSIKRKYESALKVLNNEFRRLSGYFRSNPNTANMATMRRLSKELSKIRPVQRVNLSNISIELNSDLKRRKL